MIVKFGAGAQCADFFILQTATPKARAQFSATHPAPRVEQTIWVSSSATADPNNQSVLNRVDASGQPPARQLPRAGKRRI
jgi:hypothetical protein